MCRTDPCYTEDVDRIPNESPQPIPPASHPGEELESDSNETSESESASSSSSSEEEDQYADQEDDNEDGIQLGGGWGMTKANLLDLDQIFSVQMSAPEGTGGNATEAQQSL